MDTKLKPINIEFQKLKYTVPLPKSENKSILKGVSGCFRSGELTAIMGPSGAGKSSLLNILTGFTRNGVSGQVNMNKAKLGGKKYRNMCSYILQDDNLYPTFTVHETMLLAASLKIAGISDEEKELIVDNVLSTLHLIHTKKTRCGSLSGGQRKRLSIALELLDNPPVLFLDEPTTGLDSSSSAYCVRLLHNLSREGRTIVCTIHQPAASVYEMFDHVYVLSEGECMFQGSAINTVPYLSSVGLHCPQYHNPADFLLEVANGDYGNFNPLMAAAAMDDRWRLTGAQQTPAVSTDVGAMICLPPKTTTSTRATPTDASTKSLPPAAAGAMELMSLEPLVAATATKTTVSRVESNDSRDLHAVPTEWAKFWVLVGRCHVHYYRDWTVSHLKILMAVSTAILVGLMYGDSGNNAKKSVANIGLLLIGVAYLWYTTLMPSVLKFPAEIAILKKETFNNWYKVRTYFLANMLTTSPMHILFSALYATIVFFLTDQLFEPNRYLKVVFVYILVTNIADGLGLILGALLDPINGTFVGAIVSAFKIAFCGFLALSNQIARPMQLMMYLSTISYSLEALVLALYDFNRPDMLCPNSEVYCHYKTAKMVINELGMKPQNFVVDVAVMIGQAIAFKLLAYLILKRRMKHGG